LLGPLLCARLERLCSRARASPGRCPFYNGQESEHWHAAEKMKEDIAKLEKKAYLRWQEAGN
jgi:hypothetical protein